MKCKILPWPKNEKRELKIYYRQHCTKRKTPVFNLLRGRFWGFLPHRGDTLHRWGEIWHEGPSSVPNFTPIGTTVRV